MSIGQDGVSGLAIPPSLVETRGMALPPWKKVLLVDLGFLGDTVHSVPAIRALALGGIRVDVMTTPIGAEILSLVPEVKKTWVAPLRKPSPPPWKNLGTVLAIRKEKYDAAITLTSGERNLVTTALSGATERLGVIGKRRWWFFLLPLTRRVTPPDRDQPLYGQRLDGLRQMGWEGSNPGWAWRMPGGGDVLPGQTSLGASVYLSLSAFGSPLKEWPVRLWAQALQYVWQRSPQVKFIVGFADNPREKQRAAQLAEVSRNPRQLQVLHSTQTLASLAGLLQKVDLFAGLDSGILHLAVALGKPTVSVFRDYVGKAEWAPEGRNHRILSRPCKCHRLKKNLCGEEARCLAGVSPEEVGDAISQLLSCKPEAS